MPSGWVAYLSTSTIDGKNRIPDAIYSRVDSVVVAYSKSDLTDGSIEAPTDVTETGSTVTGHLLTGGVGGTNLGPNCLDWTSGSASAEVHLGTLGSTATNWDGAVLTDCSRTDLDLRILCIEQ